MHNLTQIAVIHWNLRVLIKQPIVKWQNVIKTTWTAIKSTSLRLGSAADVGHHGNEYGGEIR